jgi:hypothetical protein
MFFWGDHPQDSFLASIDVDEQLQTVHGSIRDIIEVVMPNGIKHRALYFSGSASLLEWRVSF